MSAPSDGLLSSPTATARDSLLGSFWPTRLTLQKTRALEAAEGTDWYFHMIGPEINIAIFQSCGPVLKLKILIQHAHLLQKTVFWKRILEQSTTDILKEKSSPSGP